MLNNIFYFSSDYSAIHYYTTNSTYYFRVASRPGISGNLEKSGNFVALEKSQGNVREFCEIQKSQGILIQNYEKSGNFTGAKRISLKSSRFIQVVNKN